MRWGKRAEESASEKGWRPWFAWRPVHLLDGRWVWWQTIQRRRNHLTYDTFTSYKLFR